MLKGINVKYKLSQNLMERLKLLIRLSFHNFKSSFYKRKLEDVMEGGVIDREIETKAIDASELIVTCYFTKLVDPQHGMIRREPEYKYIKPWYDTVKSLGLNGVIVHDGLTPEFISEYETDKIQFLKFTPREFSIFEERWIAYYLLLKNNPNIQHAFFTDSNDVEVNFNPFERHNSDSVIYVGRDKSNRVGDSIWVIDEMNDFIKESGYQVSDLIRYQNLFNAGLVGGKREYLLAIISKLVSLALLGKTNSHKDMSLLNIAIFEVLRPKLNTVYFQDKITNPENDFGSSLNNVVSGFPLNSPFKAFEKNSKATFSHK